ncbi:MAG: YbjN domain-containing protein [Pseudomonadota bacterium]|jgi:hypothetical protein|nr:YbjN domain-containing protein [Pseudomonadota bacterium]
MRLLAFSLVSLGLALGVQAQDNDRDSERMTSVSSIDMRYIIESAGYTVTQPLSTGIGLIGEDSDGLIFALEGKACSDSPNCLGLEIFMMLEGQYTPKDANSINQRWSAIKATALDDGNMMMSRYLILDHGQTMENLRLNLITTRAIGKQFLDEIEGNESDDVLTADQIDWGDDSGSYANDDACDDARFHEDGDEWGYQRNHVLRDASDCRTAFEAGSLTLYLDFGDNSGEYANDDTCDDNRFTGEGRSILTTDSHVKRDSADCIAAYQVDRLNRP